MVQVRAPINPDVLRWAIDESGLSVSEVASRIKRPLAEVSAWLTGQQQPTPAQLRHVAEQVRRPSAMFYLAEPPAGAGLPANLRNAPGLGDRELGLREIRTIRWMLRVQGTLSWLAQDRGANPIEIPSVSVDGSAETTARQARSWLGVMPSEQMQWKNGRDAYSQWRAKLDSKGVFVTQFQIDRTAIRGFSAWDPFVPLIAANTAYTPQARRSPCSTSWDTWSDETVQHVSASLGRMMTALANDGARSSLRPFFFPRTKHSNWPRLTERSNPDAYEVVRGLARVFQASVRATALRLIELGRADRSMYDEIDRLAVARHEDFPDQRGGGGGEPAAEKPLKELGPSAINQLLGAAETGTITRRDVADYLHLSSNQISDLSTLVRR